MNLDKAIRKSMTGEQRRIEQLEQDLNEKDYELHAKEIALGFIESENERLKGLVGTATGMLESNGDFLNASIIINKLDGETNE